MTNVTNEKIAGPLKIILRFKSSPPEAANDTEVPIVANIKIVIPLIILFIVNTLLIFKNFNYISFKIKKKGKEKSLPFFNLLLRN